MEICSKLKALEIPIVNWRAHTTWFDVPHRMEGVPIDISHGVTKYVLYDWPSEIYTDPNHAQQQFVEELRRSLSATVVSDRAEKT